MTAVVAVQVQIAYLGSTPLIRKFGRQWCYYLALIRTRGTLFLQVECSSLTRTEVGQNGRWGRLLYSHPPHTRQSVPEILFAWGRKRNL